MGRYDIWVEKCRRYIPTSYEFNFHDLLGIVLEIYIDDTVVKSDGFDHHLADLRLAFERMRRYGLKMNPLKCAFGVSAGKFLGFIIHEKWHRD